MSLAWHSRVSLQKEHIHIETAHTDSTTKGEIKSGSIPNLKFIISPAQIVRKPSLLPNIETKASNIPGNSAYLEINSEGAKKNFADILNGLEDMSDDSTLFGGLGDEDDENLSENQTQII